MFSGFSEDDLFHRVMFAERLDQIVTICFQATDLRRVVPTNEQNLRFQCLFSFASLEAHLANLLRHQAHHEHNDGCGEKQGAHVGKAIPDGIGIEVVEKPCEKKNGAHGEKDPQG